MLSFIVKNLFVLLISVLFCIQEAVGYRRGRYFSEAEDMGLPPLEFVGKALLAACLLFIVGWIINKISSEETSGLGVFIWMMGFVCLIPALFWLQAAIASVWVVGFVIIIIGIVISFVWELVTGK